MVLHKLHAGGKVCLVELVGDVPAERTELTALLMGKRRREVRGDLFQIVQEHISVCSDYCVSEYAFLNDRFVVNVAFVWTDLHGGVQEGHGVQQRFPLRQAADL